MTDFPGKSGDIDYYSFYLGIAVGLGNILQWGLLAAAPIVQV